MGIVKMGAQDDASEINFNNTSIGMVATNVQDAIEEIKTTVVTSTTEYAAVGNYGSTYVTHNAPLTWTNISFDIIDEQTNTDIVEIDDTYSNRINIKQTGTFLVGYRINIDDEMQGRMRLNDLSTIPGSYAMEGSLTDTTDPQTAISHFTAVTLSSGDYLTLQFQATTDYEKILFRDDRSTNITIIKIAAGGSDGPMGLQGVTGSGSNINVKNNGVYVPNTPFDALNFKGNGVIVTDGGSGVADVEIEGTIDKEYFYAHNDTTTQVLSTTFVTVIIGTDVRSDSIYSNTDGEVTVSKTGNFKITADIASDSSGVRSTTEAVLQINGIDVPGSFAYGYHRNSNSGEDSSSITALCSLTANDIVRVRIRQINGGVETLSNACRLTIEEID